MKKIELKTDKTLTILSGNDFGYEVYKKFVEEKLDVTDLNIIILDSQVRGIGISFVQGFFSDLINKYSVEELKKIIKFECSSQMLEEKIWNALIF